MSVRSASSKIAAVRSDVVKLAKAILDVMDVAHYFGVKSWLCYGALLGMIREDRLLPWNNDAELACWYDEGIAKTFRDITDVLNRSGYQAFYYGSSGTLNVNGGEGVIVNLNIFWQEGDYAVRPHEVPGLAKYTAFVSKLLYWMATLMAIYTTPLQNTSPQPVTNKWKVKDLSVDVLRRIPLPARKVMIPFCLETARQLGGEFQKTGIPKRYFENFSFIEFYGGKVLIPKDSEELLEFIYGREWRIPKDSWSFYSEENKSETSIKFINEMWNYHKMDIA